MKFHPTLLTVLGVCTSLSFLCHGCLARVYKHGVDTEMNMPPVALDNGCKVNLNHDKVTPQPVYLKTDSSEFYPYTDLAEMIIARGGTFQLWCPSRFTAFSGSTLLTATCIEGTTFAVDDKEYKFNDFVCNDWPAFVAERTGENCQGDGELVRVGFSITPQRFAEQMLVCFNEHEEVTRYVRFTLRPGNNLYQHGIERLNFETANFFGGKNVDKLYSQHEQIATINRQLGGTATQFINTRSSMYLSRGHMGAKADFVYGTEQRSTFLFINVAPQWQIFNSGNWARVEDGVREWVHTKNITVICYTGVWGVTTLPNKQGVETPLYLYYDKSNTNSVGLIPVPKIYFRVVIEPATKRGIVLIGVNNPYLSREQIEKDYILCNDISDKVTYIKWKKTDIPTGYSYACQVEEFARKVPYLPALDVSGGLLL